MTVEVGVAMHLDAQGVGVWAPDDGSGSIYLEQLPQTPDAAIGIWPTGGMPSSAQHGYDSPTINVQVRGAPHDTIGARALADAVYNILHGFHGATFPDGTYVVDCRGVQSGPVSLGQDDNNRPCYSLNFQLEVRAVTMHRE